MKHEWITANVKRAWNVKHGIEGHYALEGRHPLAIRGLLDLQEALDLLHFAAERVGGSATASTSYNLRKRGEGKTWWVGYDIGTPASFITKKESESLLHAVLLAIDAIVAHKPEVFK